MYSVSSNFLQQIAERNARVERKFYIGGSDYSAYVTRFPSISKRWNDLRPQTVTIDLSNEGQTFNFLMSDPTLMRATATLKLGVRWRNLLRYSSTLSNAAWAKGSGLTVTSNDVTSTPWGNADIIGVDSGGQAHFITQITSNRSTELCTVSGYFRKGEYADWVALHHFYGAVTAQRAFFNVVSGTIGTVGSGTVARISSEGDGWWRCSATRIVSIQSGYNCINIEPHTADNQSRTFTGTGSGWMYAVGLMMNDGELAPYQPTTTSGGVSEMLTMFAGTIDAVRYSGDGAVSLTLVDKFKRLTDRVIGDTTSPVAYTGSDYLIHDLAWYACTSLGGLSAIASTNNPDIDYASFSSWSSVFSADNVRARMHLTGQQPLEALRKLAVLTQSAIFMENDKIKFWRLSITDSGQRSLDNTTVLTADATLDDRALINQQMVSAAYNVSSRSFALTVSEVASYSVGSFGLREASIAEQAVWLVDSASALNLAQRIVISSKDMHPRFAVKATLGAVIDTVGDTIAFVDPLLGIDSQFRIMGETLDLETGTKRFDIDRSQYYAAFVLDVSTLDSLAVLS